jgi:LuxR family transcriptional regulator, maltose regulon positive regulatory protein
VESAVRSGAADPPPAAGVRRVIARGDLFARLDRAGRVTEVSAPPGSGKTLLLRSWIAESGRAERAGWVSVPPQEHDPQRFWIAVADALRNTTPASELVRPLTAAPELDGWVVVERLLEDLAGLQDDVWLVIDDVHELASNEALRQLELMVLRAPAKLRFVLGTRHDLRLGLHRLRLEGELTEIRDADLRFTPAQARALFELAGIDLPESALVLLHQRTEGWAAGLRLAALSLSGHPDPERFAERFRGSERTVADYLLAEVLERQSAQARLLLMRTSIADRVCGELADLLTGDSGGERTLQDLEQAGAFVVSLDPGRSWFRYHQLFADLLRLELRRTAPGELPALHGAAAGWFAEHGYPVEAIRHAQTADAWDLATRLLTDHWVGLVLNGQAATVHELLARFPAGVAAADAELTAVMAYDELNRGWPEAAAGYLEQAARGFAGSEGPVAVPTGRRARLPVVLAVVGLFLARQRGDLIAVVEEARRLRAAAESAGAAEPGLGEDLRVMAVISLGIAEVWAGRLEEANEHLEQGVVLARRIGRPYLELTGLAHAARIANFRSYTVGAERSRQAIELARRHGWGDDQAAGVAYAMLGWAMVNHGQLDEAETWLERARRTLRAEAEPAAAMNLHNARGVLALARGRDEQALSAFQAAERLAGTLATQHTLATRMRARLLQTQVRLGQFERVEAAIGGLDAGERASAEMRAALASLRLAQDDPQAATVALAPVIAGAVALHPSWVVEAFLLEAIARDALGHRAAAGGALERALELAAHDRLLLPFLLHPAARLLQRHARHATARPGLIADALTRLPVSGGPPTTVRRAVRTEGRPALPEPLSEAETRVLRYLPTHLSAPEIARELSVSVNTVRTHIGHLYDKLGSHGRAEAVEHARDLGLLAPSAHQG